MSLSPLDTSPRRSSQHRRNLWRNHMIESEVEQTNNLSLSQDSAECVTMENLFTDSLNIPGMLSLLQIAAEHQNIISNRRSGTIYCIMPVLPFFLLSFHFLIHPHVLSFTWRRGQGSAVLLTPANWMDIRTRHITPTQKSITERKVYVTV